MDSLPENWLIGNYRSVCIGYSAVPEMRRRGASGGVITQTLLYLLEKGLIDGAVVVQQGRPKPWLAEAGDRAYGGGDHRGGAKRVCACAR